MFLEQQTPWHKKSENPALRIVFRVWTNEETPLEKIEVDLTQHEGGCFMFTVEQYRWKKNL